MLSIQYPNPSSETRKELVWTSALAGVFLYVLLLIYQPFGTSQFNHEYKYVLLFPYALIAATAFGVVGWLIPKAKNTWTLGLEIFKMSQILLITSVLSYIYNTIFISKIPISIENYVYMLIYTLALWTPISIIYLLARYIYLNNKQTEIIDRSKVVSEEFAKTDLEDLKLCIVSDYALDSLEIRCGDFLYAESADNYCSLFFYQNGIVQHKMIRISLTKLIERIPADGIQQVHRSLVVNLNKVVSFKGNSAGYKISMENVGKPLSVSRKYISSTIPFLKKLNTRP